MAKQGMKRPEPKHRKNDLPPVPGIQGKAKSGKVKANPLIAGEPETYLKTVTEYKPLD